RRFRARCQDRSDPVGALVPDRPDDLDDLLRLAQPRAGDGRGDAIHRPARREHGRARHQDRQGGVADPGRGLAQRLRHDRAAPLYFDGIVYTGITGGEFGIRGRLTALDAKTGKILWRAYTLPAPGEPGGDTWPVGTTHYTRGGASIWNTPALDPQLGLVYFAVGNCGPDYDGSMREGDNLFCASLLAVNSKTGAYAWHFQQVHHDIWDYDAASPVLLFDTVVNGQPRKAAAQAGRTGWVYIVDRANGKPLIGIEERPVPQEARQKTAKT